MADHIDWKNEIVHELLDVEFEHLQQHYQHYSIVAQSTKADSNNQCSNEFDVTKSYKAIESNVQNPELNKVTSPLNKVLLREEQ